MNRPIKKILVIRFRRVGDSVLTEALCASLKKSFPEAEIHYVLNAGIAPLFDGHPHVDRVIGFSDRDNANVFRYVARVWRVMRENRYEVIIDTRSTVRTLFFSLLGLSARYRIGTKKAYTRFLHNHRVDNRSDTSTDVIDHLLMLLRPLEAERGIAHCREFRLHVPDAERSAFRRYMVHEGVDFSRPVVLAAVTARLAHKVWDRKKMKEILQRMIDKHRAQIVLNYSGDEEEHAIAMRREMGDPPAVFTGIRARSLRELCALAVNCDFFFGNEGGPRHMAQALGLPAFAIFPPGTRKFFWLPDPSDTNRGLSPDDLLEPAAQQSMDYRQRFDLVSVEAVWERLEPMLAEILGPKMSHSPGPNGLRASPDQPSR
jgi:heptosyltransferase-2